MLQIVFSPEERYACRKTDLQKVPEPLEPVPILSRGSIFSGDQTSADVRFFYISKLFLSTLSYVLTLVSTVIPAS